MHHQELEVEEQVVCAPRAHRHAVVPRHLPPHRRAQLGIWQGCHTGRGIQAAGVPLKEALGGRARKKSPQPVNIVANHLLTRHRNSAQLGAYALHCTIAAFFVE